MSRISVLKMHTDAAQSAGKIAVNVNDLGISLLSIAGHKLYAPKGVDRMTTTKEIDRALEVVLQALKRLD